MKSLLRASTSYRGLFYKENQRRFVMNLFSKHESNALHGYIRIVRPEDIGRSELPKTYYGFFTSSGELYIIDVTYQSVKGFAEQLAYKVEPLH
jgi:hypothetical protein